MDWVRGVVERMVLEAGDVPGFPARLARSYAHLSHGEWYVQARGSFEDPVFAEIFGDYAATSEGDDMPWRVFHLVAMDITPDWVGEAVLILEQFKWESEGPGGSPPPPPPVELRALSPAIDGPVWEDPWSHWLDSPPG